jgi:hypothetical protein
MLLEGELQLTEFTPDLIQGGVAHPVEEQEIVLRRLHEVTDGVDVVPGQGPPRTDREIQGLDVPAVEVILSGLRSQFEHHLLEVSIVVPREDGTVGRTGTQLDLHLLHADPNEAVADPGEVETVVLHQSDELGEGEGARDEPHPLALQDQPAQYRVQGVTVHVEVVGAQDQRLGPVDSSIPELLHNPSQMG